MSHPLFSWDIISEALHRRMQLSEDIMAVQSILQQPGIVLPDESFINPLIWQDKTILITAPGLEIKYATQNMFAMNGYRLEEVKGKTPKMFQGPLTQKKELQKVSKAIQAREPFTAVLVNYKKDGSIYNCRIEACPIFNEQKELVYFVALENSIL
jgi:PAS domain S-box-containing protein